MKKILAVILALGMVLGLAACGEGSGKGDASGGGDTDMSKYPAKLEEWTGQNFLDYFTDAGIFYDKENEAETWLQNHAEYWPETPVKECAGWWTDDGMAMVMIFVMGSDEADTSEEQLAEWRESMKNTKGLPGEFAASGVTVDDLSGNVAISYGGVLDEQLYSNVEAAWKGLLEKLGAASELQ